MEVFLRFKIHFTLCRTTVVHASRYNRHVPRLAKSLLNKSRSKPTRQSVTIPAGVAAQVRRVAKERHLTMSRALVVLAERGLQAELDAKENLKAAYQQFMNEQEPTRKNAA